MLTANDIDIIYIGGRADPASTRFDSDHDFEL